MMENATYSILSPEGFAAILWKDAKQAEEASEVMKITAEDLKALGIIDWVIRRHGRQMKNYCQRWQNRCGREF